MQIAALTGGAPEDSSIAAQLDVPSDGVSPPLAALDNTWESSVTYCAEVYQSEVPAKRIASYLPVMRDDQSFSAML